MPSQPFERLGEARRAAGYVKPADAARALGVSLPTYHGHENGSRGFGKAADRYARFYRVSLDWLLTGRGDMRLAGVALPLVGYVGAGGDVAMIETDEQATSEIGLDFRNLAVLTVRGDSQYPRYQDGEKIIIDVRRRQPADLLNMYAVVHCADGRRMIKIIRRGAGEVRRWRLDSHNAMPEDDVEIVDAFALVGTLV